MHRASTFAIPLCAITWAAASFATDAAPRSASEEEPRLYVRLSAGSGYGFGSYTSRATEMPATLSSTYRLHFASVELAAAHVAIGVRRRDLAFGAEASGGFTFLKQYGNLRNETIIGAMPLELGAFVDYYPDALGPLHAQGGLAFGWTPFAIQRNKSCSDCGGGWTNPYPTAPESLFGVRAYVGAGYDLGARNTGGFGVFTRTHFGYFANSLTTYLPLGIELGVTMAWL